MTSFKFDTAVLSRQGGRQRNEDVCAWHQTQDGYCWVLCDGAGGHGRGDVAAKVAVDQVGLQFRSLGEREAVDITSLVEEANDAVIEAQHRLEDGKEMRSTLVMLCASLSDSCMQWANVGDSRLYIFRRGVLAYRSRDHSVVHQLVQDGILSTKEARTHPKRNELTAALGTRPLELNVCHSPLPIVTSDAFLLCSDGFWEYLEDEEMAAALAPSTNATAWLETLESVLLKRVRPNHDNYSAIAVLIK